MSHKRNLRYVLFHLMKVSTVTVIDLLTSGEKIFCYCCVTG